MQLMSQLMSAVLTRCNILQTLCLFTITSAVIMCNSPPWSK